MIEQYYDFLNQVYTLKNKADEAYTPINEKYNYAKYHLLNMPMDVRNQYFNSFMKIANQKHHLETLINTLNNVAPNDNIFEKARKSNLVKKVIINKLGRKQTVYVKPEEMNKESIPEGKMIGLFGDVVDISDKQEELPPEPPRVVYTQFDVDMFNREELETPKEVTEEKRKVIIEEYGTKEESFEEAKKYGLNLAGGKKFFGNPIKPSGNIINKLTEKTKPEGNKKIYNIPLALIFSTTQQRKDFDYDRIKELAEDIKQKGQDNPIKIKITDSGYQIIAGERRARAIKLAGLDKVKAYIYPADLTDKEKAILQAQENLLRENLNPVEEAFAFQQLYEEAQGNHSQKLSQVAKVVGKSVNTVRDRLKLINLEANILDAVKKTIIPLNVAYMLAKIDQNAQRQFFQRYNDGKLTIPSLRNKIEVYLSEEWANKGEKEYQGRFFAGLDAELELFKQTEEMKKINVEDMHKFKSVFRRTITKFNKFLKSLDFSILGASLQYEIQNTLEKVTEIKNSLGKIELALQKG